MACWLILLLLCDDYGYPFCSLPRALIGRMNTRCGWTTVFYFQWTWRQLGFFTRCLDSLLYWSFIRAAQEREWAKKELLAMGIYEERSCVSSRDSLFRLICLGALGFLGQAAVTRADIHGQNTH
jgi:hypothetical protein